MNNVTTIKMLKVAAPSAEKDLFGEEELELELYGNGNLQIIKTPDEQSFFISPDEVKKMIAGLQKGLAKVVSSSAMS